MRSVFGDKAKMSSRIFLFSPFSFHGKWKKGPIFTGATVYHPVLVLCPSTHAWAAFAGAKQQNESAVLAFSDPQESLFIADLVHLSQESKEMKRTRENKGKQGNQKNRTGKRRGYKAG